MYRIVHLSDLHYSTEQRESVRTLLESVLPWQPDHLVISGDLTEHGRTVQYRGLRDLLIHYGFAGSERLTVVPGNHDLWGFIYETFAHASHVISGIRGLPSLQKKISQLRNFRRRIVNFCESDYEHELLGFELHYEAALENSLTPATSSDCLPCAKLLPENLALIALDSNRLLPRVGNWRSILRNARAAIRNHDLTLLGENLSGSGGAVDLEALESLLRLPELAGRRKIAVLHHSPDSAQELTAHMRPGVAREIELVNHRELTALLERHGVELILHGHVHILQHYRLTDRLNAVNSGGTMHQGFFHLDVNSDGLTVHKVEHGRSAPETISESLPTA
jgi:3',5'-cyclic AMP phosphodiesterase CpdA